MHPSDAPPPGERVTRTTEYDDEARWAELFRRLANLRRALLAVGLLSLLALVVGVFAYLTAREASEDSASRGNVQRINRGLNRVEERLDRKSEEADVNQLEERIDQVDDEGSVVQNRERIEQLEDSLREVTDSVNESNNASEQTAERLDRIAGQVETLRQSR